MGRSVPVEPVWEHPRPRRRRAERRAQRLVVAMRRPWRMEYALAYDGGGSAFTVYYRTQFGARWSAFWHVHFRSWGGTARLFRND